MLIKRPDDISPSEITPERLFWNRRDFLASVGAAGASLLLPAGLSACEQEPAPGQERDEITDYADFTGYNNFYEFGTDKDDPKKNAAGFVTSPWTVRVDGLVKRPADYALDDLLRALPVRDPVYRHRCVEAWSMVVPWRGVQLRELIARLEPLPRARYVAFYTLHDPRRMPGQRQDILEWPYREGLRLDEAMNPLTLLATGAYGKPLPPQNGAPVRLVVPWKYGFKGIKSIVRISFLERQPETTWNMMAPREYGFFANVNPTVDHPRWSQARERRAGEWRRRPTLMFNGYADQVAHLYRGMDLRRHF